MKSSGEEQVGGPPVCQRRGARLPAGGAVTGLGHGDRTDQAGQLWHTEWEAAPLSQIQQVDKLGNTTGLSE